MTRFPKVLAVGLLLGVLGMASSTLGSAGDTRPSDDPLSARINIDLEDAAAADVLATFAQITGDELELAPAVEGKVTLRLRNVTARTALNATCESIGCKWHRLPGNPGRLVVVPVEAPEPQAAREAPDLDSRISVDIKKVGAATAFRTVAKQLVASLEMNPGVSGPVTLHVDDRSLREVCDLLCARLSCRWELVGGSGEPRVLRVAPR